MKKKYIFISLLVLSVVITAALILIVYFYRSYIAVLDPKGIVAIKELNLINISTLLMLIVVIPVFILTAFISWRFRASNTAAKYTPDWDSNYWLEGIWWGFPFAIVIFLSILAWTSSHELDPYKPLDNTANEPIVIQVVALDWKWLFIYPKQNIATVNYIQFPEQVPVNFEVTADAPMNSFWIPQLGGQIYAMPGMKTKLHLIADETGAFRGSSANLSGQGFAGMNFIAKATSQEEFNNWVQDVQANSPALTLEEYQKLAVPSEYDPVALYNLKKEDLFDWIIMKPMMPTMESMDSKGQ